MSIVIIGGAIALTNGENVGVPARERNTYNPNANSRAPINKGSRARVG